MIHTDTSSKPQTSFIMPDDDVIVTPNWLDNREIELISVAEVRNGSGIQIVARYKGTTEGAAMSKYSVNQCGTITNGGWFTATAAGSATVTGTAINGKRAQCVITVIDRTRVGISNNDAGASLSNYNPWKGETITINAGSKPGYIFNGWTMGSPSDGVFGNALLAQTTFRVGRTGSIALTANWVADLPRYNVDAKCSVGSYVMSGSGSYAPGTRVNMSVNSSPGHEFRGWLIYSDSGYNIQISPPNQSTSKSGTIYYLSFDMPNYPVYVYASFY